MGTLSSGCRRSVSSIVVVRVAAAAVITAGGLGCSGDGGLASDDDDAGTRRFECVVVVASDDDDDDDPPVERGNAEAAFEAWRSKYIELCDAASCVDPSLSFDEAVLPVAIFVVG